MSRIGRQPIYVPSQVKVRIGADRVTVSGPRGELVEYIVPPIEIQWVSELRILSVIRPDNDKDSRARHGLMRSLLYNAVVGVTEGYFKRLEIHGVGYRVAADGPNLIFAIGFSHPVRYTAPEGIELIVDSPTKLRVVGINKQRVGQVAADIRRLRPPDPYKGKGIRHAGEQVRLKQGKTGK